jgi:crotonobetainyl-CoA:carnitine CoA-transferase CaiB-like acyl-CoA transferase
MGGGMSITGTPETGPTRSGIPIGDLGGGLFGTIGVLAALAQREQTGRGQHVDISMLDAQISMLNYMATMYLMSGIVPEGIGNGHFVHVPYNSFPTADGHVIVACIGDAFFERFVQFIDIEELKDPELVKQPVRFAKKASIEALISEKFRTQTTAYWVEQLEAARIPCGPVNNFAQALNQAQVRAREMVVQVQLANGQDLQMPGNPVKLSDSPAHRFVRPPGLGEHTDQVLADLGYSAERLAALRTQGVIA